MKRKTSKILNNKLCFKIVKIIDDKNNICNHKYIIYGEKKYSKITLYIATCLGCNKRVAGRFKNEKTNKKFFQE